jgi:hypothetical protein
MAPPACNAAPAGPASAGRWWFAASWGLSSALSHWPSARCLEALALLMAHHGIHGPDSPLNPYPLTLSPSDMTMEMITAEALIANFKKEHALRCGAPAFRAWGWS